MNLESLLSEMKNCKACRLRSQCKQVVTGVGSMTPKLIIVGEAPGADEDHNGEPFVGRAGQILREVLRRHKDVINKDTTLITNVLGCRPPQNKFPKDECPSTCMALWLDRIIEVAQPKRMLLLGNSPLKYVAGLSGITSMRGNWVTCRGIRTLPTYHPSYIMRCDNTGMMQPREEFEEDIAEMAGEMG